MSQRARPRDWSVGLFLLPAGVALLLFILYPILWSFFGSFRRRFPAALFGGQRQRVAMGRAIVREPEVFLFDEPLSNLDARLRVQMRTEIRRLCKRLETTALYVTHDQVEAMTMADRIVVLNDGRVQQIGPPQEVYDRPANRFVAGFIGSPAMNFLHGELRQEAGRWRLVASELLGRERILVVESDLGIVQAIVPPDTNPSGPVTLSAPAAAVHCFKE